MSTVADEKRKLIIGILAIQGAVEEHADLVKRCGGEVREVCSSLHSQSHQTQLPLSIETVY